MSKTVPQGQGISAMWWSAKNPPNDPQTSFAGKTVLVTGANAGLGFEAALKIAALRASRLVLGVRSIQKGEEAKEQICQRTEYESANVKIYQLDMSSFESVKSFAKAITEREPKLDAAVLNAGMAAPSYKLSPDGYEMSLQVNVLSTALLAVLLYPKLQQSAQLSGSPSHLEMVGSVGHRMVKPTAFDTVLNANTSVLEHVNDKNYFHIQATYCITKLLLMYIMDGMVSATTKHQSEDVIITTVCPNLCRTTIGRDFNWLMNVGNHLFQLVFARTAEEGSRILVSGTTLGKDAHGAFWSHDVFDQKGELVTSEKGRVLQRKAWAEIVDILKQHVPQRDQWLLQH